MLVLVFLLHFLLFGAAPIAGMALLMWVLWVLPLTAGAVREIAAAHQRTWLEPVLRRIAGRPAMRMTLADYLSIREMEDELGLEPSEPCMPDVFQVTPGGIKRDAAATERNSEVADAGQVAADWRPLPEMPEVAAALAKEALADRATPVPRCTCPAGLRRPVEICTDESTAPVRVYCGACGKRTSQVTMAAEPQVTPDGHFAVLDRLAEQMCRSVLGSYTDFGDPETSRWIEKDRWG